MSGLNIGWPQGIAIALIVFRLIIGARVDGEPKTGVHKFSIDLCGTILNVALLYWGGFFT